MRLLTRAEMGNLYHPFVGKVSSRQQLPKKCVQFLLLAACLLATAIPAYSATVDKIIEPGLRVEIEDGKNIFLVACPSDEYDISDWAGRILANPEQSDRFVSRHCLRAPLADLSQEYQLEATQTLFKSDTYDERGWVHRITYVSTSREGGETLWNISKWFTGNPQTYTKILKHNSMTTRSKVYKGTEIKIPLDLLSPAFREPILFDIAARRAAESQSASSRHLNGDLVLKTDDIGPYASYRIQKGDTIYSGVVMRYTDRVSAADVMEAVDIICRRSGIDKPERLRVKDEVKIPLDLLSVMYLPPNDPRRKEYERMQREAEQHTNPIRSAELRDIIVILDSGHGGNDPGAIGRGGLYEDELAYDIMCRIKRRLERDTMAQVLPTMLDKSQQYEPIDASKFTTDNDEYVLTDPPYRNHDAKVSANLRWYLANSLFRKVLAKGADPDKVVFVSLHADALHPTVRGTMIYVPGAYYCRGNGGKSGSVYTSHAEVREKQYVEISYQDRVKAEGFSSEFAGDLAKELGRHDVMVHTQKPIRNHVVRRRRAWVPAVIRHNIVPTKVLVEIANLKNEEDCQRIADPAFREQFAEAFVEALKRYYGSR